MKEFGFTDLGLLQHNEQDLAGAVDCMKHLPPEAVEIILEEIGNMKVSKEGVFDGLLTSTIGHFAFLGFTTAYLAMLRQEEEDKKND